MHQVNADDLVYIPDPDAAFLRGRVEGFERDGTVLVRLENGDRNCGTGGEARRVPASEVRPRFERNDGSTSEDNTALVHMNDATILENLQSRHLQDKIYTYTASVLLAVNPYKEINGLYGDEQCDLYRGKHVGALPPHPYAIADSSYRALTREGKNQALLISGESGAGKTETAKIVMQYLSYASGTSSDLAAQIQARVLRAQPILESFGNAVTMRNSNSSRFGKYNRLFFDEAGTVADAGITTYLLESSRVVVHGDRERTYHCFYEMLTGLGDEKLQELQLERGRRYKLMFNGHPLQGFEEHDAKNFQRLCNALQTVGLEDESISAMMRVLAGLIHLGDMEKDDEMSPQLQDDDANTVQIDEESAEKAATLLGMDPDSLIATLRRKRVAVPGRGSFHEVPRTASQFRQALQSLIKALYKRLFEQTVQRINKSFEELRPKGKSTHEDGEEVWNHIGILDIYGFERLQRNSFEQLCINLANERLQQYFVENVLVAEQSLYKREGLPWCSLSLPDSQPVVNCITQVFRTLDEYSQQLAKGFETSSDEKFCQRTVDDAKKDPQRREVLKQLKMTAGRRGSVGPAMNEGFVIRHYAGNVDYNTRGWLDKNNDRLLAECEELICESECPLVSSLGEEDQGKALFRSISRKYMTDLEALLNTLGTCNLHYIRCFKPNEHQKPNIFDNKQVLEQIVQCGTIELVKIMHDGYPNRCSFDEITARFRDLLPERFQRFGNRTFIEALMLAYEVPRNEWELGMSRLFLKAGQLRALEAMRSGGTRPKAEALEAIVSGIIRKRWARAGNAVRLCNYIPRFISQIYVKRAEKALTQTSLLVAHLAPRLAAARKRVGERQLRARRKLRGAFKAIRLMHALWAKVREQRATRLAKALRLAMLLHVRTRPWVAVARERAHDAMARRRAEEERQQRERRRLEDERRRLEEDRIRLEAEQAERAAQDKQREVDQRKQMECQMEEERQKFLEDRRKFEQERQAFEQQKRLSILAQATPQNAGAVMHEPVVSSRALASSDDEKSQVTAQISTTVAGEEDEVYPGDSASAMVTTSFAASLVQKEVEVQMSEKIKALENEMAKKQEEVMEQMRALTKKNEELERTVAANHGRHHHHPNGSGSECSLSPAGEVSATPGSISKASHQSRSGRRNSMMDLSDGRRVSSARVGSRKRLSVAQEAFCTYEEGAETSSNAGDSSGKSQNIQSQRKWWAQQRKFLLEDLHPNGSPCGVLGPQVGGKGSSRMRRASQSSVVSSHPSDPRPPTIVEDERRNLSMMFENAEDESPGHVGLNDFAMPNSMQPLQL
mmetsp:Transcript_76768/g.148280  ORF Transcript_76768/g.148280 Transcript_76768/m.148280 type:complete len:1301 (-) Transcript_76768:29-3931(-)